MNPLFLLLAFGAAGFPLPPPPAPPAPPALGTMPARTIRRRARRLARAGGYLVPDAVSAMLLARGRPEIALRLLEGDVPDVDIDTDADLTAVLRGAP